MGIVGPSQPLTTCPLCGCAWASLRQFVLDPSLTVCGYQASFDNPLDGIVLAVHETRNCGTTLGLTVARLRPLYRGPVYTERKTGTAQCERLCLEAALLDACEAECDMAWIRRVIQYMRRHQLPADWHDTWENRQPDDPAEPRS